MNCLQCGRGLRLDTDGVITVRRACCDERNLKCVRAKRGSPCGHAVQVRVAPYDANEVIAAFCKEHADMDLYDDSFPDDPPPPPQTPAKPKGSPKVPVEKAPSPPKETKEKAPFKSYDPPAFQQWYQRIDMPHYACETCKAVWATNGPSERCPRCDGAKTKRTGEYTILDMTRTMFLADSVDLRRIEEGNVAHDTKTTKIEQGQQPDILVLHGYNTLPGAKPLPEEKP